MNENSLSSNSPHNQQNEDFFEDRYKPEGKCLIIPVTDPKAALQFCQSLAQLLETQDLTRPVNDFHPTPLDTLKVNQGDHANVPELSVVIPVYNEEENLPTLYTRLTSVLKQMSLSYEIVFVDDGSRDRSSEILQQFTTLDAGVTLVELARNFGHQVAISAGLEYSLGRAVIVMDADLQDPPEVLPLFITKWREGYEVVYAIREKRKEDWLKRLAYAAFYRLLRYMAHVEIPLDAGDFCIMDRRVVDLLVRMPERNRFLRGIRSWVGFKQVGLAYERHARYAGRPKYTFFWLISLAVDGLVAFSYVPLRAITLLGFSVSLFSILLALFYLVRKLSVGLNPPGFATLVVAIFFLAGVQLLTIGIIGEYVGRISEEVKQRPLYVMRRIIRRQQSCAS